MELLFCYAIISFYIKSDVQLIKVQLNANDRRAQVAMLQLAIMKHRLSCRMIGGPGKTESEGKKVLGPSMIIRRQAATIRAL